MYCIGGKMQIVRIRKMQNSKPDDAVCRLSRIRDTLFLLLDFSRKTAILLSIHESGTIGGGIEMSSELSFVLITPYSLMKSRTGGILARLLSRTDLELAGAQILTPSHQLVDAYSKSIKEYFGKRDEFAARLFSDYMLDNFSPLLTGERERVMMLLFRGENACEKLSAVVGPMPHAKNRRTPLYGETIRDTYADLVFNRDGSLNYFEPAVFTPPEKEACEARLGMLADFADESPNIVENAAGLNRDRSSERTLVIIKPENWRCPSTRPGNIIDILSKTGLHIVGCKVCQMSVSEALDFYGPVKEQLRRKLAPVFAARALDKMTEEFHVKFRGESLAMLTESIGRDCADDQFSRIIEFMSGRRPEDCSEDELEKPGLAKCMALVYEGVDAVKKIRDVLGPTDPSKAPGGTIRRDFGHDVMANTAHASDSLESYLRESRIVKIEHNPMASLIREYLAARGK